MAFCYMPLLLASLLWNAGRGAAADCRALEDKTPPTIFRNEETARRRVPAVALRNDKVSGSETPQRRGRPRPPRPSRPSPMKQTTEQILSDPALWGKDFVAALSALPAFSRAGESRVAVFPDRIVGEVRYKTRAGAGQSALRLNQSMKTLRLQYNPRFETLQRGAAPQTAEQIRAEAVQFQDDNTTRVAAVAPGLQLLPPDLTVATVRQRLGEPEKITKELLDNGTERRPVILTLYHYAGGAVVFAESDVTPRPGSVDRVYMNVPAVTAAVFKEVR